MSARRSTLEKTIQSEIEIAIGSEPDLLLLRNSVGEAQYFKEDGSVYYVPYGLGSGSPDLVGMLTRVLTPTGIVAFSKKPTGAPLISTWFCLEVKCPGEDATPEQSKVHGIWRRFGAFVEVVHSVAEARDALERARRSVT